MMSKREFQELQHDYDDADNNANSQNNGESCCCALWNLTCNTLSCMVDIWECCL